METRRAAEPCRLRSKMMSSPATIRVDGSSFAVSRSHASATTRVLVIPEDGLDLAERVGEAARIAAKQGLHRLDRISGTLGEDARLVKFGVGSVGRQRFDSSIEASPGRAHERYDARSGPTIRQPRRVGREGRVTSSLDQVIEQGDVAIARQRGDHVLRRLTLVSDRRCRNRFDRTNIVLWQFGQLRPEVCGEHLGIAADPDLATQPFQLVASGRSRPTRHPATDRRCEDRIEVVERRPGTGGVLPDRSLRRFRRDDR